MALGSMFKFRVSGAMERRANRVRKLLPAPPGRTILNRSDFGRAAFIDFIEAKERELGIAGQNGKASV